MIAPVRIACHRPLGVGLAMCVFGGGLPAAVAAQSQFSVTLQSDQFENNGSVIFLVERAGNVNETAVVHYQTEDETAVGGPGACPADYQSIEGSRTFFPEVVEDEIWIVVCNDVIHEADETFRLRLTVTDPDHSVIDSVAQATIMNDDPEPNIIWLPNARFSEGNSGSSTVQLVGSLSRDSEVPVSFDYSVAEAVGVSAVQSADAGTSCSPGIDFLEASQSTQFASGVAEFTVPIVICGDLEIEPVERARVTLQNVQGATSPGAVTFVIENDDAYPRPTVTALDPDTILRWIPSSLPSEAPVWLRVSGQDFHPDAEVILDGSPLATTFVASTELSAEIVLLGLAGGDHPVVVRNPDPSDGPSQPGTLTLQRRNVGELLARRPIRDVASDLAPARPDVAIAPPEPMVSPKSLRLRAGRREVVKVSGSGLTTFNRVEVLFKGSPTSLVAGRLLNVTATSAELEIGASPSAQPGSYEVQLVGKRDMRVTLPLALTVSL